MSLHVCCHVLETNETDNLVSCAQRPRDAKRSRYYNEDVLNTALLMLFVIGFIIMPQTSSRLKKRSGAQMLDLHVRRVKTVYDLSHFIPAPLFLQRRVNPATHRTHLRQVLIMESAFWSFSLLHSSPQKFHNNKMNSAALV